MTLNLLFITVTFTKKTTSIEEYLHYEQVSKSIEEQKAQHPLYTHL